MSYSTHTGPDGVVGPFSSSDVIQSSETFVAKILVVSYWRTKQLPIFYPVENKALIRPPRTHSQASLGLDHVPVSYAGHGSK
jgi:hypothetical protein